MKGIKIESGYRGDGEPVILERDNPQLSILDSETDLNLVNLMFGTGREQGCTILISTHDPEVIKLSDHILHLRDGKSTGEKP